MWTEYTLKRHVNKYDLDNRGGKTYKGRGVVKMCSRAGKNQRAVTYGEENPLTGQAPFEGRDSTHDAAEASAGDSVPIFQDAAPLADATQNLLWQVLAFLGLYLHEFRIRVDRTSPLARGRAAVVLRLRGQSVMARL